MYIIPVLTQLATVRPPQTVHVGEMQHHATKRLADVTVLALIVIRPVAHAHRRRRLHRIDLVRHRKRIRVENASAFVVSANVEHHVIAARVKDTAEVVLVAVLRFHEGFAAACVNAGVGLAGALVVRLTVNVTLLIIIKLIIVISCVDNTAEFTIMMAVRAGLIVNCGEDADEVADQIKKLLNARF